MGSREFVEWRGYEEWAGPIGAQQLYLVMGVICAAIYNSKRTKTEQPIITPDAFIPRFKETPEQVKARTQAEIDKFVAGFNQIVGPSTPAPRRPRRVKKD